MINLGLQAQLQAKLHPYNMLGLKVTLLKECLSFVGLQRGYCLLLLPFVGYFDISSYVPFIVHFITSKDRDSRLASVSTSLRGDHPMVPGTLWMLRMACAALGKLRCWLWI